MTTDAARRSALAEHDAARVDAPRHARRASATRSSGCSCSSPREIMFFAGLFAAYFNIRASAAAVAADQPETSEPFTRSHILPVRRAGDDPR